MTTITKTTPANALPSGADMAERRVSLNALKTLNGTYWDYKG